MATRDEHVIKMLWVWSDIKPRPSHIKTTQCTVEMAELLLDPDIRMWVILPIVIITLLFGLLRHHITILLRSNQTAGREQIKDT